MKPTQLPPGYDTSPDANRRRYEELKAAGQNHAPVALPPLSPRGIATPGAVLHREVIPGGWYWTCVLRRGQTIRLLNGAGVPGVSAVMWRLDDPSERYNGPDTIKIQWTTAMRRGRVLFSDMGRAMMSIVEDSSGLHDTLMGGSTPASVRARFGASSGDIPARNTRENFILAAGKHGLSTRDIPACITFFAGIRADSEGRLAWIDGSVQPGDFVDLRAEMDLLIALSNCPHPLAPAEGPTSGPVEALVFQGPPPGGDDPCRTATAEAVRAFENLAAPARA